jgi:hypothetical protein
VAAAILQMKPWKLPAIFAVTSIWSWYPGTVLWLWKWKMADFCVLIVAKAGFGVYFSKLMTSAKKMNSGEKKSDVCIWCAIFLCYK